MVISPRKLFLLVVAVLACVPLMFSSATNVYITPDGTSQGNCTTSPQAPAWFNSASNWGSGASQIGPGTTVLLCGTFTGKAGGTMLFFQGSGTSGNPITLLFDTGTTFTAPYWLNGGAGAGGAINTNGKSYLVISGGSSCGWDQSTLSVIPCNGTIVNTANGTNLANQATTIGIDIINSTNVEIKNIDIHNMYVRTGNAAEDPNWNGQACIKVEGTADNITIDHSICHDVGWGILLGSGTSQNHIYIGPNDEFYNADHNMAGAPTNFYVFGNHFHDWALWDNAGDAYHHDGIHCFAGSGGATQHMYVYNNQFDGTTGNNMNQFVFLEGNTSSTRCMLPGGTAYIFNNVYIGDSSFPAFAAFYGNATSGDSGDVYANNTGIGSNSNDGTGCMAFANSANTLVDNNACGGMGYVIAQPNAVLPTTYSAVDHNAYQNCTGYNCFNAAGMDTPSFAKWQTASCTGSSNTCDPHGIANMSSSTFFQLGSGCVAGSVAASCAPGTGSPLIQAGANLNSLCAGQPNPGLGTLCSDIVGNPRPTSGAWDIGAYTYGSGNQPPAPPTGLAAVVN